MTAPTLRAALEALRRDGEAPAHPLSADAERAIRRRVGTRTGLRGGALLAVAGLAVATASASWGSRAEDPAPSPTPTATFEPSVASATFPLEGGPEFEPLYRSIGCGDPAPASHPLDHDVALQATRGEEGLNGSVSATTSDGTTMRYTYGAAEFLSTLTYEGTGDGGVAAISGALLLAVRDGVVVGVQRDDLSLGWRLDGDSSPTMPAVLSAEWFDCPQAPVWQQRNPAGLEPGTYDIVAVARVFSTPEAVALSRVLSNRDPYGMDGSFLDTHSTEIYLPGSYDCARVTADGWGSGPRGCLPDMTDRASVDAEAGTVTVLYNPRELVEEFSVLLVSEPVEVELEAAESLGGVWTNGHTDTVVLDSLDAIVCGAGGSGVWIPNSKGVAVETFVAADVGLTADTGATFPGSVLLSGMPDGTRATLLPGARLVYERWGTVESTVDGQVSLDSLLTIVGIAPIEASGPITADRYEGPQPVDFTVGTGEPCEGAGDVEHGGDTYATIAGTWRIETPQGRNFTVDAASDLALAMSLD